jgi:predicted alpha/beta superfamily hydrolase
MKSTHVIYSLLIASSLIGCKNQSPTNVFENKPSIADNNQPIISPVKNDTILYYPEFKSIYVEPRQVEVWLPDGYPQDGVKYQVLYMHDGQNVFNKSTSGYGMSWEMDEKMDSLHNSNTIDPTIVVAAWNIPKKRFNEYMPQLPGDATESAFAKAQLEKATGYDQLYSNDYLKFLTSELKPFIDQNFQTSTATEDTYIMGASMGGLISMYAMMEYPDVFGGAGCLSSHWPVPLLGEALITEMPDHIPDPAVHKIYFDHGTVGLDKDYEPYQKRVDALYRNAGHNNSNFMSLKFNGHDHNENDWNRRVAKPLVFLLN